MGRKSLSGGVQAKGRDRIEFTFFFNGKRYCPTLLRVPTEANLRRARAQLKDIKARIDTGTFNFVEEFPEYKFREKVRPSARTVRTGHAKKCSMISSLIAKCE